MSLAEERTIDATERVDGVEDDGRDVDRPSSVCRQDPGRCWCLGLDLRLGHWCHSGQGEQGRQDRVHSSGRVGVQRPGVVSTMEGRDDPG